VDKGSGVLQENITALPYLADGSDDQSKFITLEKISKIQQNIRTDTIMTLLTSQSKVKVIKYSIR